MPCDQIFFENQMHAKTVEYKPEGCAYCRLHTLVYRGCTRLAEYVRKTSTNAQA